MTDYVLTNFDLLSKGLSYSYWSKRHIPRFLRNGDEFETPRSKTHFGDMTFKHFSSKLLN